MGAPVRILLLEDDPAAPVLWGAFFAAQADLELCGWARDGWSGLEALERQRPDAILMDLVLPGMDGLSFLQALQGRQDRPALVVTSPIGNHWVVQRAVSLGADYYFVKPVRLRAVADLLRALCGGGIAGYARQLLLEMGGTGMGLEAASSAAAELAGNREMLLKEAYAPFMYREHTSYGCVEKNIRMLTDKLHTAGSPAYRRMMGGLPPERPSNRVFLRRLCEAALERQSAAGSLPRESFPSQAPRFP